MLWLKCYGDKLPWTSLSDVQILKTGTSWQNGDQLTRFCWQSMISIFLTVLCQVRWWKEAKTYFPNLVWQCDNLACQCDNLAWQCTAVWQSRVKELCDSVMPSNLMLNILQLFQMSGRYKMDQNVKVTCFGISYCLAPKNASSLKLISVSISSWSKYLFLYIRHHLTLIFMIPNIISTKNS